MLTSAQHRTIWPVFSYLAVADFQGKVVRVEGRIYVRLNFVALAV